MDAEKIKKAYDGLFDEVSAAILVVLPPTGKIISVNMEAEELTGYEKSELEKMSFSEIFRSDDQHRIESIFQSPLNVPFQKLFEHNVIIQKRSKRKIVVDMGFRLSSLGSQDALVFTLQDITDLRTNQQKVLRANAYINDILHSVREALIVVDNEGVIRTINESALQMLGYSRKEIVGQCIQTLIADTSNSNHYKEQILQRRQLAEVELELCTKNGSNIPVLLSASEMKGTRVDKKGRIVIAAMDISERKKAEQLIDDQQMIIVQSSKMSALGEMASGIAHEINNPLHVIMGCCDMLNLFLNEKKLDDSNIRESIGMISGMSQRIKKIVHGLKMFSRDQTNDPMEIAPLSTIIKDTLALCEQRIRQRGITFTISPVSDDVFLECHPTMISQVILNLLNNAYDAIEADEKPWIKLEVLEGREVVTFTVTDSGQGIPADVIQNIFKPFFTTKPVGKGTGLGLSISKSVIEGHKGSLLYDTSSPHPKFVVTLPLASRNSMEEDFDAENSKSA